MANAKRCDRCGKYYDENYHDRYIMGHTIIQLRLATELPNNYRPYDLCDCCFDDLYDFLGIKEVS